MYIIQTNTSIDNEGNYVDFQSMMYKITKQNWNEFKECILSEESHTEKFIQGTMVGYTKPRVFKILKVMINDDFHLEVLISRYDNSTINIKYYMVTDEQFRKLQ